MNASPAPGPDSPDGLRRSYDRTLRREQAAETRERILASGSELLHGASVRNFKRLTVRAVAERAGVNERTVYRHFGNERGLHDAVMHRLEEEAGIDLEGMQLGDIAKVACSNLPTRLVVSDRPPSSTRSDTAGCQSTAEGRPARRGDGQNGELAGTPSGSGCGHLRRAVERGYLRAPRRRLADRPRADHPGSGLGHGVDREGRPGRARAVVNAVRP